MKIGKEEVMGVLAAVEHWAHGREHRVEQTQWERDLRMIAQAVEQVATVNTTILLGNSPRSPVPRLVIRWDPEKIGLSGLALRQQLLDDDPRIMLDDRGATEGSVFILPFSLQRGDAQEVGEKIRYALASSDPPSAASFSLPTDVRGDWDITIAFADGEVKHRLVIEQNETVLTGTHRTLFLTHTVSGSVSENRISLRSLHPFEGTNLAYQFVGVVDGDEAEGLVYLGTSGQSAPGPLNQREYGSATWRGQRASCGERRKRSN
jgi:L-seryl-tRNA(Ser) seleniumtransferase